MLYVMLFCCYPFERPDDNNNQGDQQKYQRVRLLAAVPLLPAYGKGWCLCGARVQMHVTMLVTHMHQHWCTGLAS